MVVKAKVLSPLGKRVRLNVMPPSPNHLLNHLLHTTPEAAEHLEQVFMVPGPWPNLSSSDVEGHVYFPETGLVGLFGSGTPLPGLGMALLGCQSCWWSGGRHLVQMQVLQAGHVRRIPWSLLQAQPQRYAPWLLQTAAASQQLVQDMAQRAFCALHHNSLQRLASGLLVVLNQNPHSDGQMSLADLAYWLSCPLSELQVAAQTLQAHGAVQLAVDAGTGVKLHSLQPQPLARLACSCQLQWGLGPGAY